MIVQFTQAADVLEWAIAHASPPRRRVYRCLLAQAGLAEALTFRERLDDPPLAIIGILDLPGFEGEVFFLGPPSGPGGLGRHLMPVWRVSMPWLAQGAARRGHGLICHVQTSNKLGQRLAKIAGFERTGEVAYSNYERWRLAQWARS